MSILRRPISFVATLDPEKAKAFYGDVLRLELIEVSPYALVFLDGENMLRLQIVEELCPAMHTAHGWQVTNIEREIEVLASKGVAFQMFEHLGQNPLGVWTSPDGHKIAWFKDPCGNVLSLTQFETP